MAELVGSLRRRNPYHDDAQVGGVRRRIIDTLPDGEISGSRSIPLVPTLVTQIAHRRVLEGTIEHRLERLIDVADVDGLDRNRAVDVKSEGTERNLGGEQSR